MPTESLRWLHDNLIHFAFGAFLIGAAVVFYLAYRAGERSGELPPNVRVGAGLMLPLLLAASGIIGFSFFAVVLALVDWWVPLP